MAGATARYEYGAWGELLGGGGSYNQFTYTGQRSDGETGLMALGNGERYYSPSLGRFIQQDSWTGAMNLPTSLNRYSYACNNPHKFVDPSGHLPILLPLLIAALFAINTATGYNHAEARRMERGLSEQQAGNSLALGISDATGMTMAFNGFSGQDAYTGRDQSAAERLFQGTLGTVGVIGTATGVTGALSTTANLGRTGLTEFQAAGGGLRGLSQTMHSGVRGVGRSAAAEWAGTVDELTSLRPFAQTRLGQSTAGTRLGSVLESADDAGRATATRMVEGVRQPGSRLRGLQEATDDAAQAASQRGALRQRVLANIAENRVARGASQFRKYGEFDRLYKLADEVGVSTARNEAVFYSGRFPLNRDMAKQFALDSGKKTIEKTEGGRYFDELDLFGDASPVTRTAADAIWRQLSERYARGASGTVNIFARGASPRGVFNTVELPVMRQTGHVKKYVYRGY